MPEEDNLLHNPTSLNPGGPEGTLRKRSDQKEVSFKKKNEGQEGLFDSWG